jgi:hypothetical protein
MQRFRLDFLSVRQNLSYSTAATVLFVLSIFVPTVVSAQKRTIIHRPTARLELNGLLRRMPLSLAGYSIELHPGWLVTETFDSTTGLSTLQCSAPSDSLLIFLRSASHPADGSKLTSTDWEGLKDKLRAGYGDRKIATRVVSDSLYEANGKRGDLKANFEILARFSDHLEYVAMLVTAYETIFVSADFPNEEEVSKLQYYRSIVSGIRVTK